MLQCSDMNPERKYIRRLRDFQNRNLGDFPNIQANRKTLSRNLGAFPNIQANRKTLPKKFGRFHKHSSKLKNFTQGICDIQYRDNWENSNNVIFIFT